MAVDEASPPGLGFRRVSCCRGWGLGGFELSNEGSLATSTRLVSTSHREIGILITGFAYKTSNPKP